VAKKLPVKNHSPRFLNLVTESKSQIREISNSNLNDKLKKHQDFELIDVRENQEFLSGHIPTALHLSKGIIERDIEKAIPDVAMPIAVYCSGGFRSALVAANLNRMGYTDVFSLKDGLKGWIDAGFPLEKH
jgi:rhodanese-related sulfurtransferase